MSARPVQRRLAAILVADVVNYSRMMGRDEVSTLRRLQGVLREVINPCIAARSGRVVKTTGDGVLAEFASAVEAVAAAVDIQRLLGKRDVEPASGSAVVLRIGINLGDIIIEGDDVFGDGVNIAARLEAMCQPGGLCISAAIRDQVHDKLPLDFADLGEHSLKNIARPVWIFALTQEGIATIPALPPGVRRARPPKPGTTQRGRVGMLVLAMSVAAAAIAGSVVWQVRPWQSQPRTTPTGRRLAIAVLPFRTPDSDAANGYLEDGLTVDIISALGRFHDLTVISPASVMPYKGKPATPSELGRDLKVGYVVEGSVRRFPDQVRISIGLTDTTTGRLLWSENYNEAPQNITVLQDQITRRIAGTLELRVSSVELANVRTKPPNDLEAYQLVLRARDLIQRETRTANVQARALLQQAIARDPGYAPAYTYLAESYLYAGNLGWTPDVGEVFARAVTLARKAIELDDLDAGGHDMLGVALNFLGDNDRALAELNRAITLNASDAVGYSALLLVLVSRGDLTAALAAGETLSQIQPRLPVVDGFHLGLAYLLSNRPKDALWVLEPAHERNRSNPFVNAVMAATYAELGRKTEAAERSASVLQTSPGFSAASFGSLLHDPAQRAHLMTLLTQAGL